MLAYSTRTSPDTLTQGCDYSTRITGSAGSISEPDALFLVTFVCSLLCFSPDTWVSPHCKPNFLVFDQIWFTITVLSQ